MTVLDQLQVQILQRYGMLPRSNWSQQIQNATKLIGRKYSLKKEEVTNKALQKGELLRELAGYLTIDESYFFRQEEHFTAAISYARDGIAHRPDTRVVFWSAGCSEGPEPYSIAISATEQLPTAMRERVTIFATDINQTALQRAAKGHYGTWSLRGLTEQRRNRYFQSAQNGYQLCDKIRAMVNFTWLSLQEHTAIFESESVDCIFFRNVAIYLCHETTEKIIRQFYRILRPGGLLFISSCDGIPQTDLFQRRDTSCSIYQKKTSRGYGYKQYTLPPSVTVNQNEAQTTRPTSESTVIRCERQALYHANRGEFSAAMAAANSLIEMTAYDKRGYLIRGQINLARDKADDAISDLRRAVFTDPRDPLARFWYANALQRKRARRRALIQINKLLSQLTNIEGSRLLDDGKTTASELLNATRHLKELTQ